MRNPLRRLPSEELARRGTTERLFLEDVAKTGERARGRLARRRKQDWFRGDAHQPDPRRKVMGAIKDVGGGVALFAVLLAVMIAVMIAGMAL